MPDVLEFNPNRELSFNPARDRGFDPERTLVFDPQRDLSFDADRDLPFARRGVVFRGFVCPICGVAVTEDQASCTECGAVFDREAAAKVVPPAPQASPAAPAPRALPPSTHGAPKQAPPPNAGPHRPPPPVRAYPPAPKAVEFQHCMYCGARVATGNAFCWNCGKGTHTSQGR